MSEAPLTPESPPAPEPVPTPTAEPAPAPAPAAPRGAAALLWQRARGQNTLWTFLVLLVLVAAFSALRPNAFATTFEFKSIAVESSILVVLAVGQTFVIVTSGIDLSVGSVLIFSGVVAVKTMNALDPGPNAGAATILAGALAGLLGGWPGVSSTGSGWPRPRSRR